VFAYSGGKITASAVREALGAVSAESCGAVIKAIKAHDIQAVLRVVSSIVNSGGDLPEFVTGFGWHLRALLSSAPGKASTGTTDKALVSMAELLLKLEQEMRTSALSQLAVEIAFIKMMYFLS
jgi:DNA polymerase III gamma/tau subunit